MITSLNKMLREGRMMSWSSTTWALGVVGVALGEWAWIRDSEEKKKETRKEEKKKKEEEKRSGEE
jgi:predicted MFS family arabinose efflux permease